MLNAMGISHNSPGKTWKYHFTIAGMKLAVLGEWHDHKNP